MGVLLRDEVEDFMVAAEEGSFSAAARRLYTSQPAVSARISELERRVGVPLFNRSSHGVALTPSGVALYADMRDATRLCEKAVERARSRAALEDNSAVRIGVVSVTDSLTYEQARISAASRSTVPSVEYIEVGCSLHERIEALRGGLVDVLRAEYHAELEDAGLSFVFQMLDQNCLVVSRTHPLASQKAVEIGDLSGVTVIVLDTGPDSEAEIIRCQIVRTCPNAVVCTVPLDDGLMSKVQAGSCVLLSSMSYAWEAYSTLAVVPLVDTGPIKMGFWTRPEPSQKVRELLISMIGPGTSGS